MEVAQKCVICRSPNIETHFGINACRACAVFYRRVHAKGNTYECKNGKESCNLDRKSRSICKMCRYNKMHAIVGSNTPSPSSSSSQPSTSSPNLSAPNSSPPFTLVTKSAFCTNFHEELQSLRSTAPILNQMRNAYNRLCHERREKELEGVFFDKTTFVALPVRFSEMKKTARALYEGIPAFAAASFPGFNELPTTDQNALITNFCKTFREFDGGYRSLKYFKSYNRHFFGYAKYIDFEDIDHFLAGSPEMETMRSVLGRERGNEFNLQNTTDWIPVMDKAKFSAEEFIAGVGILFWNIEGKSVSNELADFASRQRAAIMSEMHNFYRYDLCMDNYSSRIGEIFMLISTIERSIRSNFPVFELFKLMDIFDDETLQSAKMQLD